MRLDEASLALWGERIGETVDTPVVLGLRGELGAGKSVLARAIGKGAGVSAAMPSPSFNLLFRYPARPDGSLADRDLCAAGPCQASRRRGASLRYAAGPRGLPDVGDGIVSDADAAVTVDPEGFYIGFDTSGFVGSVAVVRGADVLARATLGDRG